MRSHALPFRIARPLLRWYALLRVALSLLLLSQAVPARADTFPSSLFVATFGRVYQYKYDPTTGQATPLTPPWVPSGDKGQGDLVLHPSQRFLFRVNADESTITSFAVNEAGTLTRIGTVKAAVLTGAMEALNARVYVTSFGSAVHEWPTLSTNAIWAYEVRLDGTLKLLAQIDTRGAGVSALKADHRGQYLYVAKTLSNEVTRYRFDNNGVPIEPVTLSTGFNRPISIAVSADNTRVYVANREGFSVTQCSIDSQGRLALLVPATVQTGTLGAPAEVRIDPDGRFASVVNGAAHVGELGSVSRYKIGIDGKLTLLGRVSAGRNPKAIAVASGSAFVANYGGGDLSRYKIDNQTGTFRLLDPSLATGQTPSGVVITVPKRLQAQQDMVDRADREKHFGPPDYTSYGTPLLTALDPRSVENPKSSFEFSQLVFAYFVGNESHGVTMLHAASTSDPKVGYTNFWDPLHRKWAGWEQAAATAREAVPRGSGYNALLGEGEDAASLTSEDEDTEDEEDTTHMTIPQELSEGLGR